jgi:plastocyanin
VTNVVHVPSTTAAATKLTATVGPGFTIKLKAGTHTAAHLGRGKYEIRVSDKSAIHNFHLTGPGVNKKTSVRRTGTVTWKVTFKKGKYTYVCDPHRNLMKGSFTVS